MTWGCDIEVHRCVWKWRRAVFRSQWRSWRGALYQCVSGTCMGVRREVPRRTDWCSFHRLNWQSCGCPAGSIIQTLRAMDEAFEVRE